MSIRYVNLDINTISQICVVSKIYDEFIYKFKKRKISLYCPSTQMCRRISPDNYYIFEVPYGMENKNVAIRELYLKLLNEQNKENDKK